MNFRTGLTMFVALAVLLTGIGGVAMAAQPTIDTDDTDSTGTSDITDGATVDYNESTNSTIQWDADSADTAISIDQVDDDGNVTAEDVFTSESPTVVNETDGTYAVTLEDDGSDYSGVEYQIDETVHFNATIQNDSTLDDPDELHIEFNWTPGDTQSVAVVNSEEIDDADTGMDVTTSTAEAGILSSVQFWSESEDETDYTVDTERQVNGSNTDLYVEFADGDFASEVGAAASDDAEAGDLLHEVAVTHEGHVAPVFYDEADGDLVDTETDTYAVYESSEDRVMLHLGDSYDDKIAVDMQVATTPATDLDGISAADVAAVYEGSGLTFTDLRSAFGPLDAMDIADAGVFGDLSDIWSSDDDDSDDTGNILPLLLIGGAAGAKKRRQRELGLGA